jgi:ubiquinone/menaquinone biosynthesis C-methylase UbiE
MPESGSEFDGLAVDYDRYRPDYPRGLMEALREHLEAGCRVGTGIVVDAGAGTGISTRLLRQSLDTRFQIVGLEPSEDMRRQAIESTERDSDISYIQATAENMLFDDGTLDAVVVAQAVQWFDRPAFYREAKRVLLCGGTLAILQNNRNWRNSPFLDAYETFLEQSNPAYSRNYRAFDIQAELSAVSGLDVSPPLGVGWERPMTVDGFIGMARSSSRLQQVIQRLDEQHTLSAVGNLVRQFADERGVVAVGYRSELYLARRTPEHAGI